MTPLKLRPPPQLYVCISVKVWRGSYKALIRSIKKFNHYGLGYW